MKRSFILIAIIILTTSIISAEGWKNTGSIGFSFTQTAVNKNWAGGEQNSITYIWSLNHESIKDTKKMNWTNKLQLQFGRSETPDPVNSELHIITEAADQISLNSTVMYKFKKLINPLLMVTYDSQFTEVFDPSVITETLGIGALWVEKEKFKVTSKLGVAMKQTIDAEDNGTSSLDDILTPEVETLRNETGVQFTTDLTKVFADKLTLKSELKYFNTFAFDSASIKWNSTVTVDLWKYVGITFNLQWLFDQKVVGGPDNRFPADHRLLETLAISFSYSLF